jgi:arsenite methyltransferase
MTETTDQVRGSVREHYARVAGEESSCCAPGCCGQNPGLSLDIGYSKEDLAAVPDGANLGLGCGNPHAIAELREGEVVLDLGSGAGFDCFLAAQQVGATGRVIGVDMTPEMIAKARSNARSVGADRVEFRLGEIEHLPVADASVDVVLSNCVINLSPEKPQVFRDAFRALKPGGRLAISDVVATGNIPAELHDRMEALCGCISGAAQVSELRTMLDDAGFSNVRIEIKPESRDFIRDWLPESGAEDFVASATIRAEKRAG